MCRLIKYGIIFLLSVFFGLKAVVADEVSVGKVGEFLGSKNATHPAWFKESFLDLEEDIAEATENNKRLVIYFWQPGCPYCDQLWTDNFAEQKVVDEFRGNFDVVALNMWGDR